VAGHRRWGAGDRTVEGWVPFPLGCSTSTGRHAHVIDGGGGPSQIDGSATSTAPRSADPDRPAPAVDRACAARREQTRSTIRRRPTGLSRHRTRTSCRGSTSSRGRLRQRGQGREFPPAVLEAAPGRHHLAVLDSAPPTPDAARVDAPASTSMRCTPRPDSRLGQSTATRSRRPRRAPERCASSARAP